MGGKALPHENTPIPAPPPSPINGAQLPPSTWVKGVSPNPGGAPRGKRISTRMMEMMELPADALDKILSDKTRDIRDHLAARALKRALREDEGNADLGTVLERTEGKAEQGIVFRSVNVMAQLTDEQLAQIATGQAKVEDFISTRPT